MWVQVEVLLNVFFGVMRVVGGNENVRSVVSLYGVLYYVERFVNGRFVCDNRCFKYKLVRICSYIVVFVQDMGEECIEKFF